MLGWTPEELRPVEGQLRCTVTRFGGRRAPRCIRFLWASMCHAPSKIHGDRRQARALPGPGPVGPKPGGAVRGLRFRRRTVSANTPQPQCVSWGRERPQTHFELPTHLESTQPTRQPTQLRNLNKTQQLKLNSVTRTNYKRTYDSKRIIYLFAVNCRSLRTFPSPGNALRCLLTHSVCGPPFRDRPAGVSPPRSAPQVQRPCLVHQGILTWRDIGATEPDARARPGRNAHLLEPCFFRPGLRLVRRHISSHFPAGRPRRRAPRWRNRPSEDPPR